MTPVGEILLTLMESGASSRVSLPVLLCEDARRELPILGVGITLMHEDGLVARAASSDPVSASLEELQVSLAEGPAPEAFASGRLVVVPDLLTVDPGRWPAYTPAALAQSVRGVLAYPLRIGDIHLGVLSLYRTEPGMLDDAELARALQYADAAVLILVHLQSLDRHDAAKATNHRPVNTHHRVTADTPIELAFPGQPEVHQATGMVSAQVQVSLKDALLLLQAHAYAEGVPIAEVAHAVVHRKMSFHHRS
jgi:hypothetical protein